MIDSEVMIIKNNQAGIEVWRYKGRIVAASPKGVIAEAFFNRPDFEFNGILLKENDRFLELYLFDKWYNIYEIYDRDSDLLKAWYCNVTRPVCMHDLMISYDDLALDLLVFPDARQLLLDEDEFLALNLAKPDRISARAGLKELQNIFKKTDGVDIRSLI